MSPETKERARAMVKAKDMAQHSLYELLSMLSMLGVAFTYDDHDGHLRLRFTGKHLKL